MYLASFTDQLNSIEKSRSSILTPKRCVLILGHFQVLFYQQKHFQADLTLSLYYFLLSSPHPLSDKARENQTLDREVHVVPVAHLLQGSNTFIQFAKQRLLYFPSHFF